MGTLPDASDSSVKNGSVQNGPAARTLLTSAADTTWRMFVPTIGFTFLGVWLDQQRHTKPWLMFVGIGLGFVFAYLLVRRQYNSLKKESR